MTFRRTLSLLSVVCTAVLLSGCFVIAKNVPAGSGPINDDAIVGDWRGVDTDTGKDNDVIIHIQKPDPGKPLRVIFVEARDYHIYDMITTNVGTRKVFAAKMTAPIEPSKPLPQGYFIGYYEVTGSAVTFQLLDAEKTSKLITERRVQGVPGKQKYDFATLTGSPAELARFMASPEAWQARVDDPARLRRLSLIVK